ncbi:MAG: cysteine desulfurase family protein [Bacteroidia bacterium]
MAQNIYLDYNATTPVHPEVLQQMLPWFSTDFGNAGSRTHAYGWKAAAAVKQAREAVTELIAGQNGKLIFCSGATEALNMAIKGLAASWQHKKRHLLCWATEHRAVLDVFEHLGRQGFETQILPVLPSGLPDEQAYLKALRPDTLLVCGMLANNETGCIFPVQQLAEQAHAAGAFYLCDASQAVGKIPVSVQQLGVDMLVLSAHKFYGPKGVGALWMAKKAGLKPQPLLHGGGHEDGLRSGTLPVPLIVGLGAAAQLAGEWMKTGIQAQSIIRNAFEAQLQQALPEVYVQAAQADRLPNTSNLHLTHCPAAAIIKHVRHLALATASACSSAKAAPSHVLLAMSLSKHEAECCLRISLGRETTTRQLNAAAEALISAVQTVRAASPAWLYRTS